MGGVEAGYKIALAAGQVSLAVGGLQEGERFESYATTDAPNHR